MSNGDWVSRPRRLRSGGSDGGFTLTEILVAIAVIGVVMTSVTPLFISGVSVMSSQRGRQVAVQLAADATEQVRALKGANVITGRDQKTSLEEWNNPVRGVAPYLQRMEMASDPAALEGQGGQSSTALPTIQPVDRHPKLNGVEYTQHWYVGRCWQPQSGGDCGLAHAAVEFFRVVVAVTWTDKTCGGAACSHVTSTLVSNAVNDPLFNSNDSAKPPIANPPAPQLGEVGVTLGSPGIGGRSPEVQLTATGGAPPVTFTVDNLPPGLTYDASGLIKGTPTTAGTYQVLVTATDDFLLSATTSFQWTINAAPLLTDPGLQQSTVGGAVSLAMAAKYGTGPMAWSATQLPAGLSINGGTGVISGTPTLPQAQKNATVTVTDSFNKSVSVSFGWTVNPAPAVTNPGKQMVAEDTAVSLPLKGTGGTAPLTWKASGLPAGLSINATTGLISGTPPTAGPQKGVTVIVTLTDGRGVSGSTTFIWDVLGIRTNNVGDTINLQFTLPNGNPVSSSVVNLPPGLNISATGLVSGTITGGTRYQPNLSLTDASGKVWPWIFIWKVNDTTGVRITAPTVDRETDPVGKLVSFTATAAGGTGPYTWAVNGTWPLPPGMTINSSTGLISGTPTTAGTYTVKLTVKDSKNKTADFMFTWGIQ